MVSRWIWRPCPNEEKNSTQYQWLYCCDNEEQGNMLWEPRSEKIHCSWYLNVSPKLACPNHHGWSPILHFLQLVILAHSNIIRNLGKKSNILAEDMDGNMPPKVLLGWEGHTAVSGLHDMKFIPPNRTSPGFRPSWWLQDQNPKLKQIRAICQWSTMQYGHREFCHLTLSGYMWRMEFKIEHTKELRNGILLPLITGLQLSRAVHWALDSDSYWIFKFGSMKNWDLEKLRFGLYLEIQIDN